MSLEASPRRVVGLPVALAFGLAARLGPAAGIYGAIAVGFFAAAFGGTRSLISGPTRSMTVAMAAIVAAHAENIGEAFTIVILAGLIQIMFGLLRIGRFVTCTPYSVISGFMTGVGVIIIVGQSLPFLGAPAVPGGTIATLLNFVDILDHFQISALGIAVVTLAVGLFWPDRFDKYLPSTLVALVVGTLLGVFWLTDAPVIGTVPTDLPAFQLPALSAGGIARAIEPAMVIALVGSVDTLLTGLVADSMTRTRHDPNRELLAQGLGNVLTGFIRGLPGSGATPSTVANVRAGGWTFVSGVVAVGILAVMVLTLGLTVFLDLIAVVAVGMIAAAVTSARQFERLELDSVISVPILDQAFFGVGEGTEGQADDDDLFTARVGMVALRGAFTVASSGKLIDTIGEDIRDHEVVILNFSDTVHIDDSAALVVEQLIDTAILQNVECIVMGLSGLPARNLSALDILKRVPQDQIVGTMDEAREAASRLLAGQDA